ncbi:MAG TPA: preprotein translocase subunit YajC [Steroidobacteraceae bacterium]|nr:preprotein translocase subunit YajC [Steroidobacteraceae bacterium]
MELHAVLDFLVSPAYAQAAQQPSLLSGIWPLLVLLPLFYFMLIRPQQKRAREVRDMLGKLAKGDEVITSGGLTGVLRELGENFISVEIADGVTVRMQRSAIVSVLPKGTLKAQ